MAIKKLNFSFEVPITALLSLIATGNSALKIDVMGDDKVHPVAKALNGAHPAKLAHPAMKLLEGPKKPHGNTGKVNGKRQRGKDHTGNPMTAYSAIIQALAKAPNHTMLLADLRPIVANLGLAPSSANSQISLLRTRGLVRRSGDGEYQLTASGMREAEKRGLVKAKPKPKPKPETVEAQAVTEGDNNG